MSKTIVVHNSTFHADDLFAAATLKKYLLSEGVDQTDIEIIRTRDKDIIEQADFVADVGGVYDPGSNRFDHHQKGGAGERENGIPFAAFGLVWKKFGGAVCGSEEVAKAVDERLAETIDALDNGVDIWGETDVDISFRYNLQSAFYGLRPTWKEAPDYTKNEAFFRALDIAELVLDREIAQAKARLEAFAIVEDAYKNSSINDERILFLEKSYPYMEFVEDNPQILFVIKPDSENGNWEIVSVPKSISTPFDARKLLPEEWAGKRDGDLVNASGVEDAFFVHNKRFIGVASSKEGVFELANKALETE
ncbi:MAG: MYG1 family protein [Candidatus Campbellbacteria bacterium]|nr:MYG1 family protein [Candidatus Campbellbacteria bacterium]